MRNSILSTDPLRLRHTHHRTHVSEIWTKTRHAVESGRLSRRPDRLQSSHIIRGTHDRAHLYQSRERRVRSIVSVAPTGFHLHRITACSVRVSHLFWKRFAHHHHRPVQLVNDIFYCRSLLVGQQMVRDMGTDRCSCSARTSNQVRHIYRCSLPGSYWSIIRWLHGKFTAARCLTRQVQKTDL